VESTADQARVHGTAEILGLSGRDLGPSPWLRVSQDRDDRFARAAEDWHWVHNDPERAAQGPFGRAIGHAHLTLSLVPHLFRTVVSFGRDEPMFYGYDRVRFPTAVPIGARIRLHGHVVAVAELSGAEQLTVDLRIEVQGQERPGCVARGLWRVHHLGPTG
jgi:acyl dehydratase